MQFAGQRTTLELEPIGDPVNVLVRLTEDILPTPDAILITGITPQQTQSDGVSEAEFLKIFYDIVAKPGTIFAGFNSIRFDDEFMRFLHYRNFYDAYAWQWQDGRSRWDLLDVVRMTRALRPEGITWPTVDGKPTNRLELLTKANGIEHANAHDALADVRASIAVAQRIRQTQPKLFRWMLEYRDKSLIKNLVDKDKPFIYTSGKYDNETEKTTVAIQVCPHPKNKGALVYDLRHNPEPFLRLSVAELAERWRWTREPNTPARLPVKTLQYNRCPAVAPLAVLDQASQKRLRLDMSHVSKHLETLRQHPDFIPKVLEALALLDIEQANRQKKNVADAEAQLYDRFISNEDAKRMSQLRHTDPEGISLFATQFQDDRLRDMVPRYKARNFSRSLTDEERTVWEQYRYHRLMAGGAQSRLAQYMHRLGELSQAVESAEKRYLLEELQLYAESIIPVMDDSK